MRSSVMLAILLVTVLLGGCVEYDVGVNFNNTNSGAIVQHVKLAEHLTEFSGSTFQEWLNSIESRARELSGKVKKVSDRELSVSIPFNNSVEFEQKFNRFFNPAGEQNLQSDTVTATDTPKINSHVSVNQHDFLVAVRNRLSYDLDLRSLSALFTNGNISIDPNSLLQLEFRLNTPWGGSSVPSDENPITSKSYRSGHQLVWMLQPGALNHLEAVFWLPSPLGIGAIAIALFVVAGIYLKYRQLPGGKAIVSTR